MLSLSENFSANVDFTLLDLIISYLTTDYGIFFEQILTHPAARKTYAHSVRFQNNTQSIADFWSTILDKELKKGLGHLKEMQACREFMEDNYDTLIETFHDVKSYLPKRKKLDLTLYATVGYDIGIVSENSALLNFGHPLFHEDKRELYYYTIHELHHAGYVHYHPLFTLDNLEKNRDLLDIIRYSTHMEGLGTYIPYKRRLKDHGFTVEKYLADYSALKNPVKYKKKIEVYFEIVSKLEERADEPLDERDLNILDIMTAKDTRLWYIVGAMMCLSIEKKLGRDTLVRTIINGPKDFFNQYSSLAKREKDKLMEKE